MYGPNAIGWLAMHHQNHAQLIAIAAIARPQRSTPAAVQLASQPASAPVCVPC